MASINQMRNGRPMDLETVKAISAIADNLEAEVKRLKNLINATKTQNETYDPKDPRNKDGVNLTPRGVEVIFRIFDEGKPRYAAKKLMDISFGAADYRYQQWLNEGGKDRVVKSFAEIMT